MNPEKIETSAPRWRIVIVLGLLLINMILIFCILFTKETTGGAEETHRSIETLYVLTEGLEDLEPVMEVMTVHGSIQYYEDDSDWLYFEQMAGHLSITLGTDTKSMDYWAYEEKGIQYTCITEKLGSELVWEDENGYMFYLYSSLDIERLLEIARGLSERTEGVLS